MNIVRWDPFREIDGIQARLNRMFGDRPFRTFEGEEAPFADWAPAVDIQETDKEYVVKADLPEVKKEDVKVEFEDGVLTVEGERKIEKEEKDKKFHRVERGYGNFSRTFEFGDAIASDKVTADQLDGVLTITLPKLPPAPARRIEVQ